MKLSESWIEVPIGSVTEVFGGGTPDRSNLSYFGGNHLWATPSDITKLTGYHLSDTQEKLTDDGLRNSSAKLLPIGTVLFTSRATIGKTAIAQTPISTNQGFVNLVCDEELIYNEFLVRLLEDRGEFFESRAGGSTFKEISRSTIAKIKIPLPTIPEQKQIVDLLHLAQQLFEQKKKAIDLADRLPAVMFEEIFGIAGATNKWPIEPFGKHTTYSKYGPRFPDQNYSDQGIHILRTTDMNSDGTIRWSEAPKLALTEKQIAEHSLKPGTLIISRSGTIGPVALFDGPLQQCVAGAYLIEFGIADTLEHEFVRTLFLTPYVQSMLKKAVRSVAQPNINAPNIKAILIPVPPIELQREFSKRVKELRSFTERLAKSVTGVETLLEQIIAEAFSGKLTEKWRNLNLEVINEAVKTRDEILGLRKTVKGNESQVASITKPAEKSRPARHWLINELSELQHAVWIMLRHEWRNSIIVDDPEAFNDFCTNPQTAWPIEHFNASPNRIRRTLEQLAALGLIAKVSVPRQNTLTQQTEYLTAFRPLRDDENTRLRDAETLKNELKKNEQSDSLSRNSDKWGSWS